MRELGPAAHRWLVHSLFREPVRHKTAKVPSLICSREFGRGSRGFQGVRGQLARESRCSLYSCECISASTSISATGQPHIWNHGVGEEEVKEVLTDPGEDCPGREGARVAIGRTASGRYLRVVYIRDPKPDSVFVITAYELRGKPLLAYHRRQRRKASVKRNRLPAGWNEARIRKVLTRALRRTN